VEEAEELVGFIHVAYPCVPGRVFYAVAEAGKEHHDGEGWVGGMAGERYEAGETEEGGKKGNAALAEEVVDVIV
jgi:hypothetical protein